MKHQPHSFEGRSEDCERCERPRNHKLHAPWAKAFATAKALRHGSVTGGLGGEVGVAPSMPGKPEPMPISFQRTTGPADANMIESLIPGASGVCDESAKCGNRWDLPTGTALFCSLPLGHEGWHRNSEVNADWVNDPGCLQTIRRLVPVNPVNPVNLLLPSAYKVLSQAIDRPFDLKPHVPRESIVKGEWYTFRAEQCKYGSDTWSPMVYRFMTEGAWEIEAGSYRGCELFRGRCEDYFGDSQEAISQATVAVTLPSRSVRLKRATTYRIAITPVNAVDERPFVVDQWVSVDEHGRCVVSPGPDTLAPKWSVRPDEDGLEDKLKTGE